MQEKTEEIAAYEATSSKKSRVEALKSVNSNLSWSKVKWKYISVQTSKISDILKQKKLHFWTPKLQFFIGERRKEKETDYTKKNYPENYNQERTNPLPNQHCSPNEITTKPLMSFLPKNK